MLKRMVWAALCCLVVFFVAAASSRQPTAQDAAEAGIPAPQLPLLDSSLRQVHGNDPAFCAALDDFIRCFNSVFEQRNGTGYFSDSNQWLVSSLSEGIHSPYPARQFRFSEDGAVLSLPTFTVYTPLEERCIQEITINFDEHSYTQVGYQRYRELCICLLLTFFPELSSANAEKICDSILRIGNETGYGSDTWFGHDAVPPAIFHENSIGLYPYEAIGDWRRFCVIPVTQECLEAFRQKGSVLYELEEADCNPVPAADPEQLRSPR